MSVEKKVLVVRGDLNSRSGYSIAITQYVKRLASEYDVILGVDIHFHESKYFQKWLFPLISDEEIEGLVEHSSDTTVLTISIPNDFRHYRGAKNLGLFFWESDKFDDMGWWRKLEKMDKILVPLEYTKDIFKSRKDFDIDKVHLARCPLDTLISHEKDDSLDSFGQTVLMEVTAGGRLKATTFNKVRESYGHLLTTVNSFVPRKGYPVLAAEWCGIIEQHDDVALIIKPSSIDYAMGANELFESISELFCGIHKKRGFSNKALRVFLTPTNLDEKSLLSLYKSIDFYVTCSYGEGLGLGVFEALSLGKPVICPELPGFKELLPSGYRYFMEADSGNYGLPDPAGSMPISANWDVVKVGELARVYGVLLEDQKNSNLKEYALKMFRHAEDISTLQFPKSLSGKP